jgi:hypothetical protein
VKTVLNWQAKRRKTNIQVTLGSFRTYRLTVEAVTLLPITVATIKNTDLFLSDGKQYRSWAGDKEPNK